MSSSQPQGHDRGVDSPYNYNPTLWVCATFVALFGASTLIHLAEAIYFRLYWLFPTIILAGLGETIGWSGRLWSSKNPPLRDPFLMQISSTIIAPTPLVAANFIILGRLIKTLGPQYSRLGSTAYLVVFVCADLVALVVQAVGGAKASEADTNVVAEQGARIMLGGIVFQLIAITFYAALAIEFTLRYLHDRPFRRTKGASTPELKAARPHLDHNTKLMLIGLGSSTLLIFIRSIYRTIELSDGWNGRIISTQVYFNVLDGAAILLAMFIINLLHPGYLLPRKNAEPRIEA